MIRNTAEAEDLTQQAFLQVFRKIGTFRADSVFSTWLHRLTVNIVLMHLRQKTPKEVLFAGSDQPGTNDNEPRELGSGDTSMLGAIDRLNLMRAIRQLPVGCKRLYLLQVHKARKRLRRLLLGETSQREPVGLG
jgi:RNA polymerase sigma-70 factor (ECF subfamily)